MFSTFMKLKGWVKGLIFLVVVGVGYWALSGVDTTSSSSTSASSPVAASSGGFFSGITNAIGGGASLNVCVNTWGGFAGGQWFNDGFEPGPASRYRSEYDLTVHFIKHDVLTVSRAAFNSGECDLVWSTVDSLPVEAEGLSPSRPKSTFQVDWSRGGDSIVAVRGIRTLNDLRGKSVGVALGTPSHSLLLHALDAAGVSPREIQIIPQEDAIVVASSFKSRAFDAGVMWSPDDVDAVQAVPGATIIVNTKQYTNIIADHLLIKEATLNEKREAIVKLYKGWMKGNVEVSKGGEAFRRAVQITSAGYGVPPEFMETAIRNARLTTHGDNKNFYGLNAIYNGVDGDELYTKTGMLFQEQGHVKGYPSWGTIKDTSIIQAADAELRDLPDQQAEASTTFAPPTATVRQSEAISSKPVIVTFPTARWDLDEGDKDIIDRAVLPLAKGFRNSYIRIEGNTDSVGNPAANLSLSQRRAESVLQYIREQHGLPIERFVAQGNGSTKPACNEASAINVEQCRAQNRRTEFQVLAAEGQ